MQKESTKPIYKDKVEKFLLDQVGQLWLPLTIFERSEQARALHKNGPRDVPRCGALSEL